MAVTIEVFCTVQDDKGHTVSITKRLPLSQRPASFKDDVSTLLKTESVVSN